MKTKIKSLKPHIVAGSAANLLLASWQAAAAGDNGKATDFVLWLYGLPDWVPAAFLAGLFAGLFLLGLLVYRRWLAPLRKTARDKRTAYYVAATGAVAGIVLAVLVADTWEAYLYKLITGMPPTAVGPPPAVDIDEKRAQGERLTLQLSSLIGSYQRAAEADKPGTARQLGDLAEERRQLLLELVEIDPAEVLRVELPDALQRNLPPGMEALLEKRTELEGELEVLHVDMDETEKSHFLYFLRTAIGERFALHFAQGAADRETGAQIRAKGLLVPRLEADGSDTNGALAIESGDSDLEVLALDGATTSSVPGSGLTNTFGEQRIAVLLVNFQDNPGNKPWTTASVSSLVNGSPSDFFKENSSQQTWLKADVFGWYTMPLNSTSCVLGDIEREAKNQATLAGVNLTAYSRYFYVYPSVSVCGFSGAGTVGGNPSRTWINGDQAWKTYTHELGHNLGLYHSNSLDCGTSTIGTACTAVEYGDTYDLMGGSYTAHFNAFQKERLGWLGYGASPPLITVEAGGTYTLDGYAPAGTGPKAIKILSSTDLTTGKNTWYYAEYRQKFGFDANLGVFTDNNVYQGVLLHSGSETTGNSSYLLDMTPQTNSWNDPALTAGKSFSDSSAGVTVTTLWENDTQAAVDVNYGAATCAHANPQIAISPSQGSWVPAGTPAAFAVTVTNKDGAACADAAFMLTSVLPSGWNGAYDSASLTLAPGASGSRTLTVTSPLAAADGFYNVTATAANGGYAGSVSATYVVSSTAADQPPVANSDTASVQSGASVVIAVLSNDSDPDGDALSVASTAQGGGGTVTINADNTLTYAANAGYSGTDSFSYSITDGRGGSATAIVTVTVAAANQPPTAVNDSAKTRSGTPVTITVLANDSDPNSDPLSVQSATQGNKGTVKINPDKTVTYTPGTNFKGNDNFTYTISDGKASASAAVTVTKTK